MKSGLKCERSSYSAYLTVLHAITTDQRDFPISLMFSFSAGELFQCFQSPVVGSLKHLHKICYVEMLQKTSTLTQKFLHLMAIFSRLQADWKALNGLRLRRREKVSKCNNTVHRFCYYPPFFICKLLKQFWRYWPGII